MEKKTVEFHLIPFMTASIKEKQMSKWWPSNNSYWWLLLVIVSDGSFKWLPLTVYHLFWPLFCKSVLYFKHLLLYSTRMKLLSKYANSIWWLYLVTTSGDYLRWLSPVTTSNSYGYHLKALKKNKWLIQWCQVPPMSISGDYLR